MPSTALSDPVVFRLEEHAKHLPAFVDIHIACIQHDGMVATFLPPLNREEMLQYWRERACQTTGTGKWTIIIQEIDDELAGYVCLRDVSSQTGPFRAEVLKLLVSPSYRRMGIARRVMEKLEQVAISKGLTLLLLDTVTGSPAEEVYPRLGYVRLGVIPQYGVSPVGQGLMDETFFYKLLPSHEQYQDRGLSTAR